MTTFVLDIVLLGFSYGGMVVAGALDHVGDRVRHLVLLDAFVPDDGDSVRSLLGAGPPPAIALGEPWAVPPTTRHYDDPAEADFATARSSPHPARCFLEPVHLSRPLETWPFTRTYVRATADAPDAPGTAAFEAAVARTKGSRDWRYAEIATNHMIAVNRPDELVDILLALDA